MRDRNVARTAALLFGSGFCGLVYQVAWMREFRLVFGCSTAASAAVVGIFMAGIGFGALLLGPRVDRHPRPLAFYARLETLIAVAAGLSPLVIWAVRELYLLVGGSQTLGLAGGTVARLLLSAVVLGVPTLAMGGTLPAAARACVSDQDSSRRSLAVLYGVNTLGAVLGCVVANFWALETLGTRKTVLVAALANLLVALTARAIARGLPELPTASGPGPAPSPQVPLGGSDRVRVSFVLTAAACVGFAFFLMELVWYRMLGPLLGGTVFTFGLILAVALLGIGLGGALYGVRKESRPATLAGFAATSLWEAVALAVPLALGDRIAVLVLSLKPLGVFGFPGHLFSWSLITLFVVLPASVIAGYQFPLLVALLGTGREGIGRQVGLAYAFNTVGAIVGSLAGGFGLLPLLSAPGCWRFVGAGLAILGLVAAALHALPTRGWGRLAGQGALCLVVLVLSYGTLGPTSVWRHSSIGVGRADLPNPLSPNAFRDWVHANRRSSFWEQEGVESSVAMRNDNGISFIVNGKSDGNVIQDASTQVMSGLLAALLHPAPRTAMVIGLGTGCTAGWLGAVPEMERVDVVELEPAILEVARRCAPANQDVLHNPKVHIQIGDAREVLLTTRSRYDIVFSEPSNPYRSGISSLFTREYYRAVRERLNPDGLFIQWVQAYEVDSQTVRTVFATAGDVFPYVEVWDSNPTDFLLIASTTPRTYSLERVGLALQREPFRSAVSQVWRATTPEEVLAHFMAGDPMVRRVCQEEGNRLNTDDRNLVEFGFARGILGAAGVQALEVSDWAAALGADRPHVDGADRVDWGRIRDLRRAAYIAAISPAELAGVPKSPAHAQSFYVNGDLRAVRGLWGSPEKAPRNASEAIVLGDALAESGDIRAEEFARLLAPRFPIESEVILARLRYRQGDRAEAVRQLDGAFRALRTNPWPWFPTMRHALFLAQEIAAGDGAAARVLSASLETPFSVFILEADRGRAALFLATRLGDPRRISECLEAMEPDVPWTREGLELRRDVYKAVSSPRLAQAEDDLVRYWAEEPQAFRP